jgi:hypothetical protein
VTVRETVNAKRVRFGEQAALALLDGVDHVWAARGKRVVHLDLAKAKPSRAELLAVLLGPSGNLRAPALRRGRTLIVGFDEGAYGKLIR